MMALPELLLFLGGLFMLGAWIWLLVVAFRTGIGWGLLIFFLGWTWVPLIVFAVKFWKDAKKPLVLYGFGFFLGVGGILYAVFALGMGLDSIVDESGEPVAEPTTEVVAEDRVLPPPRPSAQPTHPSWEAVVREMDTQDDGSWETLVPSPTPVTGRPGEGRLDWESATGHTGKKVILELHNNTVVTATLEAVEPDRIRIRHVIGGGEASYWIERDQVSLMRLAK